MFDYIVVALDDSAHSKHTLEVAKELAETTKATVRVLHVREYAFAGRAGQVELEDQHEATAIVDQAVEQLQAAGIDATGNLRGALLGHAAQEILDEASGIGADLIVMGSRGRSELAGLIVGSTLHKVLHLGKLPVLVVR